MSEQAGVTMDEVRRVAELANLEVTAEEEPRMQRDLNAILGYIAQLNELDTAGVPPMAQVGEVLGGLLEDRGERVRGEGVRLRWAGAEVWLPPREPEGGFLRFPRVTKGGGKRGGIKNFWGVGGP